MEYEEVTLPWLGLGAAQNSSNGMSTLSFRRVLGCTQATLAWLLSLYVVLKF